jgi:hypothetical protein
VDLPGTGVIFNNVTGLTWNGVGLGLWDGNTGTGADKLWLHWEQTFTVPTGQGYNVASNDLVTLID